MSDGAQLQVNRWIPDDEENIKGVIQLNHGLSEHSMRYDRLGSVFAENGFVFNAHDMRGHGKTAEISINNGNGIFGKLADKKGSKKVVEDLNELITGLKSEYPGKKVFLLGHSFGSFVSQGYIEKYSEQIDGCILCGTAGPRPLLIGFAKILTSVIRVFCGNNAVVSLLPKIAFGAYNSHIENPKTVKDWLSRNELNVQMNSMDEWCNIDLTSSFYDDMMSLLKTIHKPSNMKKISKDLPINLIYGSEDPVGDWGKTVKKLYEVYKKNGIKNLQIKAYENDRHEIFNEVDQDVVENDVISWLNKLV